MLIDVFYACINSKAQAQQGMTRGKKMDAYTALAEVEVDEAELTNEGVVVGEDVDAWMDEMLSGPADYDY